MRTFAYWLYFTAIAVAIVLSDRAIGVRAAAAGVWVVVCLGAAFSIAARQVSAWRARRGWVWLASGLCSRCAYPSDPSFVRCPECGGRFGSPPTGPTVRRVVPRAWGWRHGTSFGTFNIS